MLPINIISLWKTIMVSMLG